MSTHTQVQIALYEIVPMVLHGLTFLLPLILLMRWPNAPTWAHAIERRVCASVGLVLWVLRVSLHDVLVVLSQAKIVTVTEYAYL